MSGSKLVGLFGHAVVSLTQGVTERYNPENSLNSRQRLLATILLKAQV